MAGRKGLIRKEETVKRVGGGRQNEKKIEFIYFII
jgi:hypothetical protein